MPEIPAHAGVTRGRLLTGGRSNLTFRLDDPNTGTVLTGSTIPGSIPAAGTAVAPDVC